jgi:hypothetical protein
MATSGLAIVDLNGDGRKDVVAIGASTGNAKRFGLFALAAVIREAPTQGVRNLRVELSAM